MTTDVCKYCKELRILVSDPALICEYCVRKYAWSDMVLGSYYYDLATGRILAKITVNSFKDDTCRVEADGTDLGSFISEAHAKTAVENRQRTLDQMQAGKQGHELYMCRMRTDMNSIRQDIDSFRKEIPDGIKRDKK